VGCNCGKKRMAQYSSKQARQQASGEAVVASAVEMSVETGQVETASNIQSAPHATGPRV